MDEPLSEPFLWVAAGVSLVFLFLTIGFASIAIALRISHNRRERRRSRLEAEWMPVLLDVLNWKAAPDKLQERVLDRDRAFFVDFVYRVGRQLRGHELDIARVVVRPFLADAEKRFHSGDAESRARRIQILGMLSFDTHVSDVKAALDDPSPLVRMVAARALVRKEHPEYVHAVLARLEHFRDWSPSLLSSLLASLGPSAVESLRELLADKSRDDWSRCVAADALGRINDTHAADIAARILSEGTTPSLAIGALLLLERTGRGEHVAQIRSWVNSLDEPVRAAAFRALSRIGADENQFRNAIDDQSRWVARYAAEGLKKHYPRALRDVAASGHPRSELAQQVLVDNRMAFS